MPYIQKHVQLSECKNMTLQRVYIPQGQAKPIHQRMGEWSHFKINQEGQVQEDQGQLKCPGVGPGPRSQPEPPDHVLMEMQVRIQLEHLVANSGQVNSERDRLWLPCLVRETAARPCTRPMCGMERLKTVTSNMSEL
ncbi:MAG: hypothetical protein GY696_01225 [Gammaproteobacteria bacterium]|nr:hypothetical protein [Gammaproteobacteria bacterium]